MASRTEPESQETAESQEVAASPTAVAASPTAGTHHDAPELENSIKLNVRSNFVPKGCNSWLHMEPWQIVCDLYYKGTPAMPEYKKGFSDAPSALAHFALRHMLSESRDCSPTLLWTRDRQETCGGKPRVHQAFNVYPLIDGPRRIELAKQPVNLHWAIITFTDGPPTVKSTDLDWEDGRLMAAVHNITSMGYHVDVWSSYDDNGWRFDIREAESQHRQVVQEKTPLTDQADVFSSPIYLEHRERYEACMRHGLAGFTQEELTHLDTMQNEILHAQQPHKEPSSEDDYVFVDIDQQDDAKLAKAAPLTGSAVQNTADLETKESTELMGFLEHMEESITEHNW